MYIQHSEVTTEEIQKLSDTGDVLENDVTGLKEVLTIYTHFITIHYKLHVHVFR